MGTENREVISNYVSSKSLDIFILHFGLLIGMNDFSKSFTIITYKAKLIFELCLIEVSEFYKYNFKLPD